MITGISLHQYVHRWHVSKNWAFARLIAEVTRSVLSVSGLRLYLHYLFTLQLPNRLKPLLRTLNVLHLESTRSAPASWEARRDLYIANRVGDQIAFYEQSGSDSGYRFAVAAWTFLSVLTRSYQCPLLQMHWLVWKKVSCEGSLLHWESSCLRLPLVLSLFPRRWILRPERLASPK